jgi:hypothetical protein
VLASRLTTLGHWLTDLYLLAAVLLLAGMTVMYNAFEDNPHLAAAAGCEEIEPDYVLREGTGPDGTYSIVGLPGDGVISAISGGKGDGYLTSERLALPWVPQASPGGSNVISEINPPETAITYGHDPALERVITRFVRVVDPEGKLVSDAWLWPMRVREQNPEGHGEYRVSGLRPTQTMRVDAVHEGRKLAGTVTVDADKDVTAELKLQPMASVIGRVVQEDGQPLANLQVSLRQSRLKSSVTDSLGRFRVEGLTPGRPMIAVISRDRRFLGRIESLTLKPGEVRDLGDVTVGKQ